MGLNASTVETVEALDQAFAAAMATKGPSLIEVML
jgi:thiamine pyrophosphate-dependent acetolactate synthase large subunit-like protein